MAKDPVMNASEANESPEQEEEIKTRSRLFNVLQDERIGGLLIDAGLSTVDAVAQTPDEDLLALTGLGEARVEDIREKIPYQPADEEEDAEPEAEDEADSEPEPEAESADGFSAELRELGIPHPPGGTYDQAYPVEGADYIEAQTVSGQYRLYLNVPESEFEWEQVGIDPASDEPPKSVRVRRIAEASRAAEQEAAPPPPSPEPDDDDDPQDADPAPDTSEDEDEEPDEASDDDDAEADGEPEEGEEEEEDEEDEDGDQ